MQIDTNMQIQSDVQQYVDNIVENDNQAILQNILGELMQNPNIEYCSGVVCGKNLVLGIIPYSIYSRSQREDFRLSIVDYVLSYYDFDNVDISFDCDIIYELSKYNGEISQSDYEDMVDSIQKRR